MKIDISSGQKVFENSSGLFSVCHCSTLVKNEQGDMLVSYFAGTKEGASDQGIWLSRRINGTWETPKRIKYMYGFIHWNPLLHYENGITYLFYKVGMTVEGWYTMISVSHDFGKTWSESSELIEGDHTPRASSKNKILVTDDGRWLGPCSKEGRHWDAYIDISPDKGRTWTKHLIPFEHIEPSNPGKVEWNDIGDLWMSDANIILEWDGIIQPALWASSNNDFHCLMRSTRGWLYRSDSNDSGNTWSTAYKTEIPNNNCGVDLVSLAGGTIVLFYNPVSANWGNRTPLSISLSTDNGKTWTEPEHIETGQGEYSYPAAITDGKNIDLIYTWQRKCIMHRQVIIN